MIETEKLERKARNLVVSFDRLLAKARDQAERNHIKKVGRAHIKGLEHVLN